ncbi:YjfB family protein [Paenibacillus eucommiae]|uniref:Motility protein n=1 Tax=Paenibacillus eucommiae TaxID=1355755 RepID=A0ABS4IYI6_9BACL|nr:YjfB family protein [Paenibacillus eucommiae]MBP1992647.1 hypothetical protein [Paenibacillus eucommiae]
MDIALLAMSLNQAKLQESVSLSVLKMALGNTQEISSGIAQLLPSSDSGMARSVQPHLGGSIDIKA